MIIYVMRHGLAVSQYEFNGPDSDRPLSEAGEKDLKDKGPRLQAGAVSPEAIFSSPYLRARQTADIVASFLTDNQYSVNERLASGVHPNDMVDILKSESAVSSLMIVGHMPEVAGLCSRLTSVASFLEDGLLPGEIAAIEVDSLEAGWGKGKLLWRKKLTDW